MSPDIRRLFVNHSKLQTLNASKCLDREFFFLCQPVSIDIFCRTPQGISTHLSLCAVRVEYTHTEITDF